MFPQTALDQFLIYEIGRQIGWRTDAALDYSGFGILHGPFHPAFVHDGQVYVRLRQIPLADPKLTTLVKDALECDLAQYTLDGLPCAESVRKSRLYELLMPAMGDGQLHLGHIYDDWLYQLRTGDVNMATQMWVTTQAYLTERLSQPYTA